MLEFVIDEDWVIRVESCGFVPTANAFFLGEEGSTLNMGDPAKSLRTVLGWQVVATALLTGVWAWLAGAHGALSALLGGSVAMMGGLTFALLAKPQKTQVLTSDMAWDGLGRILKAEGAKVLVMIISLWLVLASYQEVVMLGFIGTFIVSVVIFSMAIFLRNPASLEAGKNNVN